MDSLYEQFKPARAKVSIKVADLTSHDTRAQSVEQKIDGQRYVIQTDCPSLCGNFKHGLTSRRVSTVTGNMVEKHDRVPHISNHSCLPSSSMLDCELVSSGDIILKELPGVFWDKLSNQSHPHMLWLKQTFGGAIPTYPHVGNTVSIMGSLPDAAVEKQEDKGFIWAYAFDLLNSAGRSTLKDIQCVRRGGLANALRAANPEDGVILMPAWDGLTFDEIMQLFEIITSRDPKSGERGEGLILKYNTHPYNHAKAWTKVKKDFAADVVFTGRWDEGKEGMTGKMLSLAGQFEIGVYYNGVLEPIGWISAIMDSEGELPVRTAMAKDGALAGQVIECHFNKLQTPGISVKYPLGHSLQHPRYGGLFRPDKNAEDCTLDALLEICKK